jgi:hypothetical protein
MGALLRQLHSPIPLRKLHLDCRLDEAFVPGGIPWASLPNLTTLTCSARYVDTLKMELADLAIPQHSPLTRLGLAYYVQHTWEDRALRQLHLPRLRTLDLRRVDALNPAFVPQMVRSFDEALGQRTRWPALEEMVVPTHTFAPDLRAGLMDVAARHGLRLTSAPPTPDVVSP